MATLVETLGGRATPVCTDPPPALYDFLAGVERFRTDPEPGAAYDLLVISDCGTLDRVGDVRTATRGSSTSCRGSSSTITSRTRPPRPPTGSIRRRPRPARWSPSSRTACGVPLDAGGGGLAAALMAGDRDGHGDLRPPQRHAADAGRLGGPRRGRCAAVRDLAPALPQQAGRAAAPVRAGPRPPREHLRRAGRLVEHPRRGLHRDGHGRRPVRGDHRPAVAGRARPRSRSSSRSRAVRPGSASGRGRAAWTRPC